MGFLQSIFGLKGNKKVQKFERNVVLVKLSDIDEWVKINCSDIDSNYFSRKFSNILNEITDNAENLLKVRFESDTDPRVRQKVESNIDSYVKHISSFVKKIDLELIKIDTKKAIDLYEEYLNNFNLQTQKNFIIVSALFKVEAFRVSNLFKNFSLILAELKKSVLDSKSIVGLDIYGRISKVKGIIETNKKFLIEEKEKTDELEKIEKEILEKKQSIESFTQSKEYKDIVNSDKRKEALQVELEDIKSGVVSLLSSLEGAFKRLVRIMPNIDLKEIALDRVLEADNKKIFEYSKELKESLKNLDIKEEKKQKVYDALEKVFDGTLEGFIKSYFDKIGEIKNIDISMIDSQISKNFIDLNYKINSLDFKKNRLVSELERIRKKSPNFEEELKNSVKDLEDVLSLASNQSVKINI